MKKDAKTWALLIVVFFAGMIIAMVLTTYQTCCSDVLKYHTRKKPDVAMEEYLEEKYDDDVTCLSWESEYGLEAYWNKDFYLGTFESKKYPGVKFDCGANVKEDRRNYKFKDDYLLYTYRAKFRELIEEIAAKYFEGEFYVVVEPLGDMIEDKEEIIPFEDYVKRYLIYRVSILSEEMSDEDAIESMQKFVNDAHAKGFQCDFNLGRLDTNENTYENFYSELWENDDDFDLWNSGVKWLYSYDLPLKEGESEPEVYIWTEEQDEP